MAIQNANDASQADRIKKLEAMVTHLQRQLQQSELVTRRLKVENSNTKQELAALKQRMNQHG